MLFQKESGIEPAITTDPDYARVRNVIDQLEEKSELIFKRSGRPEIGCVLVSRRPYSFMAKLKVSWPDTEKTLYVKMPLSETDHEAVDLKREYEAHSFFYDRFADNMKYGVVKPVCYLDTPPAFITEEEKEGLTLHRIIQNRIGLFPSNDYLRTLIPVMKRCGEWLKQFQSIWPIPENINISAGIPYRFEETIRFVERQIDQCAGKGLISQKTGERVLKYLGAQAVHIDRYPIRITAMHSDYLLSHIIIEGDAVKILDFDGFKTGPSCRDVATFLYSLDRLCANPVFRASTIKTLKLSFLDGYRWNPGSENIPLFHLFQIREIFGELLEVSKEKESDLKSQFKWIRVKNLSKRLLRAVVKSDSLNGGNID